MRANINYLWHASTLYDKSQLAPLFDTVYANSPELYKADEIAESPISNPNNTLIDGSGATDKAAENDDDGDDDDDEIEIHLEAFY